MLDHNKPKWIDLFAAYKELTLLWDPKHKDYTNKRLRFEANNKLLEKYKVIDSGATVMDMKNKIERMRTTYNRERKKVTLSKKKGGNYVPTLWYYKHLRFLDATLESLQKRNTEPFSFNRYNNKIYLEKGPGLRRKRAKINGSGTPKSQVVQEDIPSHSHSPSHSSEEENTEYFQPSPPKRIHDLLQKQENFVATVSTILAKKEDWEITGRAIGLQLSNLDVKQRMIAQKLISDAIFFGSMDRLTVDSFVHVNEQETADFDDVEEHVLYIGSESPDYDTYE